MVRCARHGGRRMVRNHPGYLSERLEDLLWLVQKCLRSCGKESEAL